jgi:hypothetical protein
MALLWPKRPYAEHDSQYCFVWRKPKTILLYFILQASWHPCVSPVTVPPSARLAEWNYSRTAEPIFMKCVNAGFYENLLDRSNACSVSEHMNEHLTQNRARVSALMVFCTSVLGKLAYYKIFKLFKVVLKSPVTVGATSQFWVQERWH